MRACRRSWQDLFPESESALLNGLAGAVDRRILEHAAAGAFVLVSTDGDFKGLMAKVLGAKVVILRSCDYPTKIAEQVIRRNAVRILRLSGENRMLVLERG